MRRSIKICTCIIIYALSMMLFASCGGPQSQQANNGANQNTSTTDTKATTGAKTSEGGNSSEVKTITFLDDSKY